jgi:transcriptional regulator with XRE-family HTH domain
LARTVKSTDAADLALGRAIRMWRRARRISQQALARTCGVTFQQLRKYETATDRISISRLARIAETLRCPCRDIVRFLDLDADAAPPPHPVTLQGMTADRLELLLLYVELDPDQLAQAEAFVRARTGDDPKV